MLLLRGATRFNDSLLRAPFCFNTCSFYEEQLSSLADFQSSFLFQYMLLLRGATHVFLLKAERTCRNNTCLPQSFQYMLLLRGATNGSGVAKCFIAVSIHAPLARSNLKDIALVCGVAVSIHAPLARSNLLARLAELREKVSIHAPLARSNLMILRNLIIDGVSIHAPLARSNSA